jgi:hypothetical protein
LALVALVKTTAIPVFFQQSRQLQEALVAAGLDLKMVHQGARVVAAKAMTQGQAEQEQPTKAMQAPMAVMLTTLREGQVVVAAVPDNWGKIQPVELVALVALVLRQQLPAHQSLAVAVAVEG